MATLHINAAHYLNLTNLLNPQSHKTTSVPVFLSSQTFSKPGPSKKWIISTRKRRSFSVGSVTEDREVVLNGSEEFVGLEASGSNGNGDGDDFDKLSSRAFNALIVLGFGTFAVSKLLTIDHDYWHTLYVILRYVPEHNWIALSENDVKWGSLYSWRLDCPRKPLLEFDRTRMFRSGLVGFSLHGSLSHYYYQFCEALFPLEDWWVVPAKIAFDQTVWAAIWNSIYFVVLGVLRFESPTKIFDELKATFRPMLTAGWKLWPFAHVVTYGLIPLEQRLLWVDCVELIWVTILSTYFNEKSESTILELSSGEDSTSSLSSSPKD